MENYKELQSKWQNRIQNDVLEIDRIESTWISGTHPFVVGPKHVEHAADKYYGRLGDETLRAIPCAHCRRAYDNPIHKSEIACYLRMKRECTQREVTEVICPVKGEMELDGISGFAFLNHSMITDWGK